MDEPEIIVELLKAYPEFQALYREVYEICRNMEDIMGLFSEELAILDKNTVDYMIDEMQETIDEQKETINEQKETINEQKETINEQKETINEQRKAVDSLKEMINGQQKTIDDLKNYIEILMNKTEGNA